MVSSTNASDAPRSEVEKVFMVVMFSPPKRSRLPFTGARWQFGSVVGDFSDTHFAAGFRAGLAGFSATLAMFIVVLAALLGALIAYLGAKSTEALGDAGADLAIGACHERSGHPAYISTVAVQLDAVGHHLHIRSAQTRRSAMVVFFGAGLACLYAVRYVLDV